MARHTYRLRDEVVPDDALAVVRGGLLEVTTLRGDAEAARRRFGLAGISVFGAPDAAQLEKLAGTRLARFEVLTLIVCGALRMAALELLPTFRSPHFTITLPNLDDDLLRVLACENTVWVNPFYVPPR